MKRCSAALVWITLLLTVGASAETTKQVLAGWKETAFGEPYDFFVEVNYDIPALTKGSFRRYFKRGMDTVTYDDKGEEIDRKSDGISRRVVTSSSFRFSSITHVSASSQGINVSLDFQGEINSRFTQKFLVPWKETEFFYTENGNTVKVRTVWPKDPTKNP
jgi:hypothetical protein